MKISDLLTSPPPATGWSLDSTMAVVVRRQSKGELRSAAVEVPDGTFEVGPVGLQAVDEEKLRPVLARLQDEVEGTKRAAVVVPTGWLRTHILEFDQLPRRQADLREMVLWRLKKLLPVAPSSLRLATVTQPPSEGARRLLVLVGVERAIAGSGIGFRIRRRLPGADLSAGLCGGRWKRCGLEGVGGAAGERFSVHHAPRQRPAEGGPDKTVARRPTGRWWSVS